jgi:hypothetical protein
MMPAMEERTISVDSIGYGEKNCAAADRQYLFNPHEIFL